MQRLVPLIAVLALAACRSAPQKRSEGQLEFRTTVAPNHPEATAFNFEGTEVYLGDPQRFYVEAYMSQDTMGMPALGFEVIDQEKTAFRRYTTTLIDKPMAVIVGGEVVTMPTVNDSLPGAGMVNGGADGFKEADVQALIRALNAGD